MTGNSVDGGGHSGRSDVTSYCFLRLQLEVGTVRERKAVTPCIVRRKKGNHLSALQAAAAKTMPSLVTSSRQLRADGLGPGMWPVPFCKDPQKDSPDRVSGETPMPGPVRHCPATYPERT